MCDLAEYRPMRLQKGRQRYTSNGRWVKHEMVNTYYFLICEVWYPLLSVLLVLLLHLFL
jgi:hypothetical protein